MISVTKTSALPKRRSKSADCKEIESFAWMFSAGSVPTSRPRFSRICKESLYMEAPSNATTTRRIFKHYSLTRNVKDSRNLTSKEYQTRMVSRIHGFLKENLGEKCMAERTIQFPSQKDFIKMFQTIYTNLSPEFKLQKGEREIVALYQHLGYPHKIKVTSLQAPYEPHSWPVLLGALTWLIDLVEVKNKLTSTERIPVVPAGESAKNVAKKYLKYNWLKATYKNYNLNRTADREKFLDEEACNLRDLIEKKEQFATQHQKIQATLHQLETDCAELETNMLNNNALEHEVKRVNQDIEKCSDYNEDMREHVHELTRELEEIRISVAKMSEELMKKNCDLDEVKKMIDSQEEDAVLLVHEVKKNREVIQKKREEMQHLKQINLSGQLSKALDEENKQHEKLLLQLKDVIHSALHKYPHFGKQYPNSGSELLSALDITKELMETTQIEMLERREELKKIIDQYKRETEEIKAANAVELKALQVLQRDEGQADRERKQQKEELEKEVFRFESDIEILENEKEELEKRRNELSSLRRDLQTMRVENEEFSQMLAASQARIKEEVASRLYLIIRNLDQMQEGIEWMTRQLEEFASFEFSDDEDENNEVPEA